MEDAREQFSAKLPKFFAGAPDAPVVRVRDVVICVTTEVENATDEYREHPPIASPLELRLKGSAEPVSLGRGVRVDRLSNDDAELVMNACSPRGHYFHPIRQFGQRYSFVREVDLGDWEHHPFQWDPDDVLWDCLSLSRLVRDNNYSTQYAARIADFDNGEQTVVYTLAGESKHVYRLRRDRDWLDVEEGAELRDLAAAYWSLDQGLPARARRAMWRTEYASWLKWGDLAVAMIVSGLEALLKTERHGSTRQFTSRVPELAAELGFDGVTPQLCDLMYDARSEWVHGAHVRMFASGQEAQERASFGPESQQEWDTFASIALLQDVLRQAVRRTVEDTDFRLLFEADDEIERRWG